MLDCAPSDVSFVYGLRAKTSRSSARSQFQAARAAQIGWREDFRPAILLRIKATEVTMNFRIRGLEARQFDHLFTLSDAELAEHGAVRRIADGPRPCRISLSDAKPGDELILVNHEHHAVSSPYRMRFAIYIRRGEETFD